MNELLHLHFRFLIKNIFKKEGDIKEQLNFGFSKTNKYRINRRFVYSESMEVKHFLWRHFPGIYHLVKVCLFTGGDQLRVWWNMSMTSCVLWCVKLGENSCDGCKETNPFNGVLCSDSLLLSAVKSDNNTLNVTKFSILPKKLHKNTFLDTRPDELIDYSNNINPVSCSESELWLLSQFFYLFNGRGKPLNVLTWNLFFS